MESLPEDRLASEQDAMVYRISDEALERAAAIVTERADAFTLSFCSGLETCPG